MDYTLQVDKQGQLLAHWLGQSQGHQQALNQVHHQAIKSAPPLSDWHVTTNLAQSILSVGQLHQLCFSSSHTSCSSSHSAPTLLLLHSHAATQLQLHHFLHCTLTDANRRIDSLQHSGALATRLAQPACMRPSTCSSCLTAASLPRAPTSRTWLNRRRVSRSSAAAWTCEPAASCPTAAQLLRWGIHINSTISRFLHWGQGLVTCAHHENEDGICYEDLTASYSTSGVARLVRWGIHVIRYVIKILTLGTGPGNVSTSWECGWNMLWRVDSNLAGRQQVRDS